MLQLIDKMLVKQPEERISIIDILHDPWLLSDSRMSIDLHLIQEDFSYDESPLVKHAYEPISPLKREQRHSGNSQ